MEKQHRYYHSVLLLNESNNFFPNLWTVVHITVFKAPDVRLTQYKLNLKNLN